jgi:threonine synthase
MVAVQAEGCAPIVRAFETGAETAERWEGAATRAGGLRVPAAVGDMLILDALRSSGGTAIAVSEEALTEAQGLAGRLMGSYVAPESGAALAAVRALRDRGDLGGGESVVVFDCGIGQKYPPPPGLTSTAAG